jgi:hypothetical protein
MRQERILEILFQCCAAASSFTGLSNAIQNHLAGAEIGSALHRGRGPRGRRKAGDNEKAESFACQ